MGLYVVGSAKGSPGVTTSAIALAGVWPIEPIVADLDPAGGDLALRYRDPAGAPLDPDRGVISLGAAARRGGAAVGVEEHIQQVSGGLEVLVGVSSPTQVQGLGPTWKHLAHSLRAAPNRDVIADCGRIMPGSATMPVMQEADAVLLIAKPSIESLAHLRERISGLTESLRLGSADGVPLGVAVIASYKDTGTAHDVQSVLNASRLPATVIGILAEDLKAAGALQAGAARKARGSLLMRSAAAVAARLRELGTQRIRGGQAATSSTLWRS